MQLTGNIFLYNTTVEIVSFAGLFDHSNMQKIFHISFFGGFWHIVFALYIVNAGGEKTISTVYVILLFLSRRSGSKSVCVLEKDRKQHGLTILGSQMVYAINMSL